MSRGGRGGFRGGGAGRGGGRQSGAMQLISFDLLKESGNLFNVQTALFPEMDVPVPHKLTERESLQWKRRKEYLDLVHNSPFYLQASPPRPDIERYSDKYKTNATKKLSLQNIRTDLDFFPEELHSILDPRKRKKKQQRVNRDVDDAQAFEALINSADEPKEGEEEEDKEKSGDKENDASDAELEEEYEEEELFDDNDYAQNYFDNGENDDADDDDGEPEYS